MFEWNFATTQAFRLKNKPTCSTLGSCLSKFSYGYEVCLNNWIALKQAKVSH